MEAMEAIQREWDNLLRWEAEAGDGHPENRVAAVAENVDDDHHHDDHDGDDESAVAAATAASSDKRGVAFGGAEERLISPRDGSDACPFAAWMIPDIPA